MPANHIAKECKYVWDFHIECQVQRRMHQIPNFKNSTQATYLNTKNN